MKSRIPFFLKAIGIFAGHSVLLLCLFLISGAFAGDVIIICNKNVPESSLAESDIKDIYLGKKREWSNGESITPVTLKEDETHKDFCAIFISKSPAQFKSYWKNMQFTGKGQMLKSFDSDKEMIDYIAGTEGAIGYISSGKGMGLVKTLSIN